MENRRSIYYHRNTIKPKISQKCKDDVKSHNKDFEAKIKNKFIPKTCATSKCLWCGYEFNRFRISCPYCGNCQYCGFKTELNQCILCGNKADDETKIEIKQIKVL